MLAKKTLLTLAVTVAMATGLAAPAHAACNNVYAPNVTYSCTESMSSITWAGTPGSVSITVTCGGTTIGYSATSSTAGQLSFSTCFGTARFRSSGAGVYFID